MGVCNNKRHHQSYHLQINDFSLLGDFNSKVTELYDQFVPLRTVIEQDLLDTNMWFNDNIRRVLFERDVTFRFWRSNPSDNNRDYCHRVSRKSVTQLIKTQKKNL